MKKLLAWILILSLCMTVFVGCGKEDDAADSVGAAEDEIDGELCDAGNVTMLVPKGWTAYPETDVFAEEDDALDPDVMNLVKGGTSEYDLFVKPYVRIVYSGPSELMLEPDSGWYDNVEELEPFTTGEHLWNGFSCESMGVPLVILWCEEGAVQYQATLSVGSDDDTIAVTDADVQTILASVEPSNPEDAEAAEEEEEENQAPNLSQDSGQDGYWAGQWYGWWCIKDGSGNYAQFNNIAWDLYAIIEDYENGDGYLTMWDTETSKDVPLVRGYIHFENDGSVMVSDWLTFYDGQSWLPDVVTVQSMDIEDWYVDPADSSVTHFDHMIEIIGYYEDPNNSDDSFTYYMYLRPWGTDWEDVRSGDTSACIYNDMMPVIYDGWYVPLMELGVKELPDSYDDGVARIEAGE